MQTIINRVIIINAKEKKVEVKSIENELKAFRKVTEGPIAMAKAFDNGDVLYVNDEGLLDDNITYFFTVKDGHQPFAGNGIIVGEELEDLETGVVTIKDALSQVEDLDIKFLSKEEVCGLATQLPW